MLDIKLSKTGLKNPKKNLKYRRFTVTAENHKLFFEFVDCYRAINGNRSWIIEVSDAELKILIFEKTVAKKNLITFEKFIEDFVKTQLNGSVKKIENNLYF